MNIAQTTRETLGLMKDRSPRPSRCRPASPPMTCRRRRRILPDDHAYEDFPAARGAALPGRRGALAHHQLDHRLGLRRDGLGAGRPALGEHELSGRPQNRTLSNAWRGRHGDVRSRGGRPAFEDIDATATLRILQKTMRKEEPRWSAATPRLRSARPARRPFSPRALAPLCQRRPIR